jgi:hypothetical protein
MGADLDSGARIAPIAATLDDVRVYRRSLDATEIIELVTAP